MSRIMMRESPVKEVKPIIKIFKDAFPNNLVVTITKNGDPLSRFSDDIWDYSATSNNLRNLHFKNKIDAILLRNDSNKKDIPYHNIDEAVIFLKTLTLHWLSIISGCSMSKLNGDLTAISYLNTYCLINNIEQNEIFQNAEAIDFLIKLIPTEKQVGILLGKIQRITDTASTQSKNSFWQKLKPSCEFLVKLKETRKIFPETTSSKQTLLIPSNIYQGVLKKTIEDLNLFLKLKDEINYIFSMRGLARDRVTNSCKELTCSRLNQKQKSQLNTQWKTLVDKNTRLARALQKVSDLGVSKNPTWAGLLNSLSFWQLRCSILIASFTGMRKNEILAIPLNGLKFLDTDNGPVPIIWSTTTKLERNGKPRLTKWVTSSIVQIAFDVAKIIALGILDWAGDRKVIPVSEKNVPLFLSAEHGKYGTTHPRFDFGVVLLGLKRSIHAIYKDELKVSQSDLAELSWFMYGEEPDNIKVGMAWPLAFHQFRRSMAVYAAASGMVSYPVLKAQLQHISMIMTVYYSDSSSRAINILGNEQEVKALGAEWANAKARIESDNLHQLLNSNQPLAGSAGKILRAQQLSGDLPNFLESREKTQHAVKNGKIRYRSTLVGGCMSQKHCNKGAGVLASACISCESAIFLPGSKAALEQTKVFYEAQLAKKPPMRARQEYELNIKKINSFMSKLVESTVY